MAGRAFGSCTDESQLRQLVEKGAGRGFQRSAFTHTKCICCICLYLYLHLDPDLDLDPSLSLYLLLSVSIYISLYIYIYVFSKCLGQAALIGDESHLKGSRWTRRLTVADRLPDGLLFPTRPYSIGIASKVRSMWLRFMVLEG